MIIQVNGVKEEHTEHVCALDLLKERCGDQVKGVAIARNGSILTKENWQKPLSSGDKIEIIVATQGG